MASYASVDTLSHVNGAVFSLYDEDDAHVQDMDSCMHVYHTPQAPFLARLASPYADACCTCISYTVFVVRMYYVGLKIVKYLVEPALRLGAGDTSLCVYCTFSTSIAAMWPCPRGAMNRCTPTASEYVYVL